MQKILLKYFSFFVVHFIYDFLRRSGNLVIQSRRTYDVVSLLTCAWLISAVRLKSFSDFTCLKSVRLVGTPY